MARSGIMLCVPFEEKRLAKWEPPYIVQPKLDGERCRSVESILLSSQLNSFNFAVPHIGEAVNDQIPYHTEPNGELYVHGMSFEEIHSIVSRKTNLHPNHLQMEYHIFDYVENIPQYERIKMVNRIELKPPLFKVESYICGNLEGVLKAYDKIINLGYEGIVVRHIDNLYVRKRSTFLMKFKPKKQDDYLIVGYKEEVSKDGHLKGRLGSIICVGLDGTEFSVGSGLTDIDRVNLWEDRESLRGKTCTVKYQHITSGKGVPRFPVFTEVRETFINPLLKTGDL